MELPAVAVATKSTVVKDQIACWLSETAGSDEVAVRSASLHLEGAQTAPKFLLCLLELAAGTSHSLNQPQPSNLTSYLFMASWGLKLFEG